MKTSSQKPVTDLEKLRDLLVEPEREKIEQITERLENSESFSSQVSDVLPEAFINSSSKGGQLKEAMVPAVEDIVRISIERDTDKFAKALFPVIGPAIRKAISESMRQMLQSLNQMLESSLSVRGLMWRWQSIRTGVSFAEIVMLHSLVYRVEQVFLIHRGSGLLLNHLSHNNAARNDADLISSMLSAITDFVGDSFDVDAGEALDTVQFGELSIWLAQGPDTALALAIRGDAPAQLRIVMQQTLEDIQTHFANSIANFDGDTKQLAATQPYLDACLQAQYSPPPKKLSLRARLIWTTALILIVFGLVSVWHDHHLQQQYVQLIKNEPGYVVIDETMLDNRLVLRGLRDPLAREPLELLNLSQLTADDVVHDFEPYQSLDKQFARQRMLRIIQPPPNVSLSIVNDVLFVEGFASEQWINNFLQLKPLIAGIDRIDGSGLQSEVDLSSLQLRDGINAELDINRGHLRLSGFTDSDWWQSVRDKLLLVPGVLSFDISELAVLPELTNLEAPESVSMEYQGTRLVVKGQANTEWINRLQQQISDQTVISELDMTDLLNSDEVKLTEAISSLSRQTIFFAEAESFTFEEQSAITATVELVHQILDLSRQLSRPLRIVVQGFTDSQGDFEDNQFLSRERAEYVAQSLYLSGINPGFIEIKGIDRPVPQENSPAERRFNRRVSFDVVIPEGSKDQ